MNYYRKKPVVIEAIQFSGKWEDAPLIHEFTEGQSFESSDVDGKRSYLYIITLEGSMRVSPKDFVIKGVNGEFYPIKENIFAATYEAVENEPS